jgi:hypothetical protein
MIDAPNATTRSSFLYETLSKRSSRCTSVALGMKIRQKSRKMDKTMRLTPGSCSIKAASLVGWTTDGRLVGVAPADMSMAWLSASSEESSEEMAGSTGRKGDSFASIEGIILVIRRKEGAATWVISFNQGTIDSKSSKRSPEGRSRSRSTASSSSS